MKAFVELGWKERVVVTIAACGMCRGGKSGTYPMLKLRGAKLNPPPAAPVWGGTAGVAGGAGDAAAPAPAPAPKVKTPEVLLVAPNPLAPNWKPPPDGGNTQMSRSGIAPSRGSPDVDTHLMRSWRSPRTQGWSWLAAQRREWD